MKCSWLNDTLCLKPKSQEDVDALVNLKKQFEAPKQEPVRQEEEEDEIDGKVSVRNNPIS